MTSKALEAAYRRAEELNLLTVTRDDLRAIIRAFAQNISEEALLQMASARNRFLAKHPQAPFETSAAIALRAAIEKDLE